MKAVKNTRTSLERNFWSLLAGSSISGWTKNPKGIFGNPDVAFLDKKIAIYIDGCFWHGCPKCKKEMPVTNAEYWRNKIERNIKRAGIVNLELENIGWKVIRIWGHQLNSKSERYEIIQDICSLL